MLRTKKSSFVSSVIAFLFSSITCSAQVLSGLVVDGVSKEPISFATVWIKGSNNAVVTHISGEYEISYVRSSDTLCVSALGYKEKSVAVSQILGKNVSIDLVPQAIQIDEIVITPGKNPANAIVKKAIRNRRENQPTRLENIDFIEYTKLNLSLSGIDSSIFRMNFIRKHPEILVKTSVYDSLWSVPLFFSENMFYRKFTDGKPIIDRQIVSNQHGSSFIESDIVTQYITSLNEDMTFYGNLRFLKKDFISPIAGQATMYYRYYLHDSIADGGKTYYRIRYKPRNKQDLAFFGYMLIEKETGTLTEIDATLQRSSNVNFVRKMHLFEKLQLTSEGLWFRKQQFMDVEFVPDLVKDTAYHMVNTPLTAIKNTTYIVDSEQINSYVEKQELPEKFNLKRTLQATTDTMVLEKLRPDSLSSLDMATQNAIQITNEIPAIKVTNKFIDMFMYGYIPLKYIDLGPYLYFVQHNKVEGLRLNLAWRTSNKFHDKMLFGGYLGYGCLDQKFKFGLQYSLRTPFKNYGAFHFKYDQNIYRIGDFRQNLDFIRENVLVQSDDNLLSALLARTPNDAVYFVKQFSASCEQVVARNLDVTTEFLHAHHFNAPYHQFVSTISDTLPEFFTNELSLNFRFSFNESVSTDHFRRIYIDSRYPVIHFNVLQGHYQMNGKNDWYTQFRLVCRQNILLGFGRLRYVIEAGMLSNAVPFPLLEVHRGNETGNSGKYYFNQMKYMEFASDAFVNLYMEYGFDGFLLNKIWGIRKLQMRELLTFKTCYGALLHNHNAVLQMPSQIYEFDKPYMEAGVGVTNLLRFIRLEYIWRLNYRNHPEITKSGLFVRFSVEF